MPRAYLKASNVGVGDFFGASVAIDDGLGEAVVVVGAPYEAGGANVVNGVVDDSQPNAGAAYVYVRANTSWHAVAYVKVRNPGTNNAGSCMAVAGARIAVGAPTEDSGTTGINPDDDEGAPNSGAIYVFE